MEGERTQHRMGECRQPDTLLGYSGAGRLWADEGVIIDPATVHRTSGGDLAPWGGHW